MDKNKLASVDLWSYNNDGQYLSDDYNKKPLFCWEEKAIQKYFNSCKTLYVYAAGGGREVYNLSKMGYDVSGSEYNENFRSYANDFLAREKINLVIEPAIRDKCNLTNDTFDGIIFGWGFYTHIKGKIARIEFLTGVSSMLIPNGVLLISFWKDKSAFLNLSRIEKVGNFVAKVWKNDVIELGDSLTPEFVHYFSKMEIEKELEVANFKIIYYDDEDYGHVVAQKIE